MRYTLLQSYLTFSQAKACSCNSKGSGEVPEEHISMSYNNRPHPTEQPPIILEPHYAGISSELLPEIERVPLRVVLDNIRSAYNVGAIFRTSDAAALEHIHLCGVTAHPPSPKLQKTALGAFDYVPWSYHPDTSEALDELVRTEYTIVALENTPDAELYYRFTWPKRSVLILGNEVEGISPQALSLSTHKVVIPVLGYKRTLNVATAFGIVVFEILRQWNAWNNPNLTTNLSTKEPDQR